MDKDDLTIANNLITRVNQTDLISPELADKLISKINEALVMREKVEMEDLLYKIMSFLDFFDEKLEEASVTAEKKIISEIGDEFRSILDSLHK